jgi:hypothetical protein
MNDRLYNARHTELSPAEAALLWRFTQAYRPHDTALTPKELRAQGLEPVAAETVMDTVREQFEEATETEVR